MRRSPAQVLRWGKLIVASHLKLSWTPRLVQNIVQSWLWHWYTFYNWILQTHSRILLSFNARLSTCSVRESAVWWWWWQETRDTGDTSAWSVLDHTPSSSHLPHSSWWDFVWCQCQWWSSSPYHPHHDAGVPPITTWIPITTGSTHLHQEYRKHSGSRLPSRRTTIGADIKEVSIQGWYITMTFKVFQWIMLRKKSPLWHSIVTT